MSLTWAVLCMVRLLCWRGGLCLISEFKPFNDEIAPVMTDHVTICSFEKTETLFLEVVSPMSTPDERDDSDSCDTLPPARLPPPISFPPRWPSGSISPSHPPSVLAYPNSRKLCVRHQRIADEGTNLKLQQVCSLVFPLPLLSDVPCKVSTLSFIMRRDPAPSGAHHSHLRLLGPRQPSA